MLKLACSILFIALIFLAACMPREAIEDQEKLPATKWQLDSYSCAFGCDPMLEEILNAEIGKQLDFNKPSEGFSLFTECNGKLNLKEQVEPSQKVIRQLNQTISPEKQFTLENIGFVEGQIRTAQAMCQEGKKTFTTFWVVSLSDAQMTVYYEGASFLNFSPVK
jgi:hypothetical protein